MATEKTPVLLVHGMGRTPLSMVFLAQWLKKRGFRAHLFGYSATLEPFEGILDRLERRFPRIIQEPWLAIGHSLGGLILRGFLSRQGTQGRSLGLVTLGTPHRSPLLARRLHKGFAYRLVHGDCGQMLADPNRMEKLPIPAVPTLAVVGTAGPRGGFSPFGDQINDAVVGHTEAHLPGMTRVEVPGLHTFLMNHPLARQAAIEFFQQTLRGKNQTDQARAPSIVTSANLGGIQDNPP